jgi:hypothetical protein
MENLGYPYNQYIKNGKVDMKKIVNDANVINDHILTRLLLIVCQEQHEEIKKLKVKGKKETGGTE